MIPKRHFEFNFRENALELPRKCAETSEKMRLNFRENAPNFRENAHQTLKDLTIPKSWNFNKEKLTLLCFDNTGIISQAVTVGTNPQLDTSA